MTETIKRCGHIAIVGRPNVGKSTLLNHILGQKLSITSRKPQTTRHKLLGIKTTSNTQYIYVDTPGIHWGQNKAINRYMNRAVTTTIHNVDVIVFMIEKLRWLAEDERLAKQLIGAGCPVILAVNKVDTIENKELLLPHLQKMMEILTIDDIIPVSALQQQNLDQLEKIIRSHLPENDYFYPEDQITDRSSRFLAAEIVREKITRQLGDELPYQMTVEIEQFVKKGTVLHIHALILVERESQKRILIGSQGDRLKKIGQQAREDMQTLFDSHIMLKTWVKVKSGWSDDERALRSLGYDDR